jgi:D-alanyl-D-alanine dipeptidase
VRGRRISLGFTPLRPGDEFYFGVFEERMAEKLRQRAEQLRSETPGLLFIPCAADGCQNEQREWWYFCSQDCRDAYVRANQ